MAWEVVPPEKVPQLLEDLQERRCVACHGPITNACGVDHRFYCCNCDDSDCPKEED